MTLKHLVLGLADRGYRAFWRQFLPVSESLIETDDVEPHVKPEEETRVYRVCPICHGAGFNWLPDKDRPDVPVGISCWSCSGLGILAEEDNSDGIDRTAKT